MSNNSETIRITQNRTLQIRVMLRDSTRPQAPWRALMSVCVTPSKCIPSKYTLNATKNYAQLSATRLPIARENVVFTKKKLLSYSRVEEQRDVTLFYNIRRNFVQKESLLRN